MIYFDQSATSFPTLSTVIDEMVHTMKHVGANPGRGTHSPGVRASEIVNRTRIKASEMFNCTQVCNCLFFSSATVGLNQAILGYPWNEGDHVIATTMEHNSVRRPLEAVKKNVGINISYVTWDGDTDSFIKEVKEHITSKTKMIAMTHASNITGDILPIKEVCKLCASNNEVTTLVDASQTVGHIPIDMHENHIDMLVFPGHKALQGPKGIGMLLVNKTIDLRPIHYGGGGEDAISANPPKTWPHRFETGTMNVPAIAGLYASFMYMEENLPKNVSRETNLVQMLLKGLEKIEGITLYGPNKEKERVPVIAWNVHGVDSEEVAMILDSHYEIAVRAGLHCNVLGHKTLHTVEQGVLRISINATNTEEEVKQFLQAVEEIAQSYNS